VRLRRGAVVVAHPAKGRVARTVALRDAALHRLVNSLLRRRGGAELLACKQHRQWVDVRSADLNIAVEELAGAKPAAPTLTRG